MNILKAIVPENMGGLKASAFLAKAMPLLPAWALRDAFKKRDVKMDDRRISEDEKTVVGALLCVYTPVTAEPEILFEDDNVIVLNKPSGISVEDDARGGMNLLKVMQERAKGAYRPRLCHRLDNPTCGILVMAKNDDAEKELLTAFKERDLEKIYECLVKGTPKPEHSVCEAWLVKDAKQKKVRIISHNTPESKKIITEYTVLQPGEVSRVCIQLHTGRTHQIRAQMAFLAHPILGDDKYGDRAFNKEHGGSRLMLCAKSLTLHTQGVLAYLNGKSWTVKVPF